VSRYAYTAFFFTVFWHFAVPETGLFINNIALAAGWTVFHISPCPAHAFAVHVMLVAPVIRRDADGFRTVAAVQAIRVYGAFFAFFIGSAVLIAAQLSHGVATTVRADLATGAIAVVNAFKDIALTPVGDFNMGTAGFAVVAIGYAIYAADGIVYCRAVAGQAAHGAFAVTFCLAVGVFISGRTLRTRINANTNTTGFLAAGRGLHFFAVTPAFAALLNTFITGGATVISNGSIADLGIAIDVHPTHAFAVHGMVIAAIIRRHADRRRTVIAVWTVGIKGTVFADFIHGADVVATNGGTRYACAFYAQVPRRALLIGFTFHGVITLTGIGYVHASAVGEAGVVIGDIVFATYRAVDFRTFAGVAFAYAATPGILLESVGAIQIAKDLRAFVTGADLAAVFIQGKAVFAGKLTIHRRACGLACAVVGNNLTGAFRQTAVVEGLVVSGAYRIYVITAFAVGRSLADTNCHAILVGFIAVFAVDGTTWWPVTGALPGKVRLFTASYNYKSCKHQGDQQQGYCVCSAQHDSLLHWV